MGVLTLVGIGITFFSDSQRIADIADRIKNNYIKCDELGEKGYKKALCVLDLRRDLNKKLEINKKSLNYLSYLETLKDEDEE